MTNLDRIEKGIDELRAASKRQAVQDIARELKFRGKRAEEDFVALVTDKVSDQFGILHGPGNETLEEFVKVQYDQRPHFHGVIPPVVTAPPKATVPASSATSNKPSFDSDRISPQMSDAELAEAWKAISEAYPQEHTRKR